jgi:hypothetical protein
MLPETRHLHPIKETQISSSEGTMTGESENVIEEEDAENVTADDDLV